MHSQQPCTIDYETRIKYVILWVSDSVIGAKPLDRIKNAPIGMRNNSNLYLIPAVDA